MLPTLIDLCGLGDAVIGDVVEHEFDGRSLVPLLRDSTNAWPDRAVVTDSQRVAHPIKWRKSAVMTGRWRLVNGAELYDMHADPGQRHDIAAQHPNVVARLRSEYEAWWEEVSQQFDAEIPMPIGGPGAESVRVNTHDWRNEECACAWNQNLIREGMRCNGYWEIDVRRAGRYQFELRRWPREEIRPLTAGIPGEPVSFQQMTIESGYGGGHAIPVQTAAMEIGGQQARQPISETDEAAVFTLELAAGATHLQTWFECADGEALGAYYVYVDAL